MRLPEPCNPPRMPNDTRQRRPPSAGALGLLAVVAALSGGCRAFGWATPGKDALAACRDFTCRGATALEGGDWRQAEQLLRKAVDAAPGEVDTRRHLAETLWRKGDQAEAIAHLRVAVQRAPDNASLMVQLGQMLLAQRGLVEARDLADQALRANDQLPAAWALRGRAYRELGDPDRALADLHQALRLAPDEREVLAEVAQVYADRGMPRRQLTTLHRLADTYPPDELPPGLLADEGAAYLAMGRPRQAVERFRLAAAAAPANASLLYYLASAEEAAGNHQNAVVAAQQALGADAGHAPSRELLARLAGPIVGEAPAYR